MLRLLLLVASDVTTRGSQPVDESHRGAGVIRSRGRDCFDYFVPKHLLLAEQLRVFVSVN